MSHRKRVKKTWLQIATEVAQELDFLGYDSTQVRERGLYGDWYCFDAPGREPQDMLCIEVHRKGYGWRHYAKRESYFTTEEYEEFCRRTREELKKMLPNDNTGVVAETLAGPLGVTKGGDDLSVPTLMGRYTNNVNRQTDMAQLSKSRFTLFCQCPKALWLKTYVRKTQEDWSNE